MKMKKNGKVIKINSIIEIELTYNNQTARIQFEPINKINLKNFYNYLNVNEKKKLLNMLSLPRNSFEYLWDERKDHNHFYKHIKKINKWNIQRQEGFLESLLKKEERDRDFLLN
jgi:hypothetical protein